MSAKVMNVWYCQCLNRDVLMSFNQKRNKQPFPSHDNKKSWGNESTTLWQNRVHVHEKRFLKGRHDQNRWTINQVLHQCFPYFWQMGRTDFDDQLVPDWFLPNEIEDRSIQSDVDVLWGVSSRIRQISRVEEPPHRWINIVWRQAELSGDHVMTLGNSVLQTINRLSCLQTVF